MAPPVPIKYSKCPPQGFQKPDALGLGPKCMCASCGSELGTQRNFDQHKMRYIDYTGNTYKMSCTPNTTAKEQRVSWYAAVWADPHAWRRPKCAECPVCLETRMLRPFCNNEHLVCETCRPRLQNCPLCREPRTP